MVPLLWLELARNDNIPSPRDIVNKANRLRLVRGRLQILILIIHSFTNSLNLFLSFLDINN